VKAGRAGLLAVLAAVLLGGVAGWLARADDSLERLRERGTIRIGFAIEPPYAFVDGRGEVAGESPGIARRIVARLGIARIDWRQAEFGALIDELEAGRIDVIAAGMFATPERSQRARFSDPTLRVRPGVLVARGNPTGLRTIDDLASRTDLRVAVLAGAVEADVLAARGVAPERLIAVPDALTGRQAVESGIVAALVLSEPSVRWMASQNDLGVTEALALKEDDLASAPYGYAAFAFHKDDAALQAAWNAALADFLGSAEHRALLVPLGLAGSRRIGAQ
jgi:polar amino acid transport system substrate-binding protein